MRKVRARIKAPFGEIVMEADSPNEILETLRGMPFNFMEEMSDLISTKLNPPIKARLEGIVEFTKEGPIIITKERLTHYEAIGLVLYASIEKMRTAAQIRRLLKPSGIKPMVPGRLNEMHKRVLVFKQDPSKPDWKLTAKGKKWIEEEVLVKLRRRLNRRTEKGEVKR